MMTWFYLADRAERTQNQSRKRRDRGSVYLRERTDRRGLSRLTGGRISAGGERNVAPTVLCPEHAEGAIGALVWRTRPPEWVRRPQNGRYALKSNSVIVFR